MRPALAGLLLALAATGAAAQPAIPPVARVTDLTGSLDPSVRASLEQRLAAFEQSKGSQVAVLLVPSTQPETIEQYAIRVAEAWKLGRKGVDDGAILLVAKDDRAVRIEVGYGLEGAVPDAIAKRIVEETIVPRFREGDFAGGVGAGVEQLLRTIEGEPLPEPAAAPKPRVSPDHLLAVGFFMLMFGRAIGHMLGALVGALVAGGLVGAGVWFVLGGPVLATLAGIGAFVITLLMQGAGGAMRGARGGWGGGYGGGYRGGGGFGGGGFRGGGGGFGGGGASGRW